MEKIISVSGVDVPFKSSGALPRLYRTLMGRDLFRDMNTLENMDKDNPFDSDIISIVENIAYVMAKHADPKDKRTIEQWLEQFDMFGIVGVIPEIIALWNIEIATQSDSKKNEEQ